MMSGELSMSRWKYFLSSDIYLFIFDPDCSFRPELFRAAQPELWYRNLIAEFFKRNLDRHPAAYVMRLDAEQIRHELASLFELDHDHRVRHLGGEAGVIELMHYIEAEDLAPPAYLRPLRPGRV